MTPLSWCWTTWQNILMSRVPEEFKEVFWYFTALLLMGFVAGLAAGGGC